jgi:hypothetical protein
MEAEQTFCVTLNDQTPSTGLAVSPDAGRETAGWRRAAEPGVPLGAVQAAVKNAIVTAKIRRAVIAAAA